MVPRLAFGLVDLVSDTHAFGGQSKRPVGLPNSRLIMSCLSRYTQTHIFQDIADEAISTCRQSLVKASNIFASRQKDARLDSQLFLIRHLLILKEMTASVDIVSRSRAGLASGGVIGEPH